MKLPSLRHVISSTRTTIAGYPFETLCALVATICGHLALREIGNKEVLAKTAMCASLGLVVFLSSSLFLNTSTQWSTKRFIVQPFLLLLLIGYYFTFSETPREIELLHFAVLNICFHLAVSFAAFINTDFDVDIFWEFNKRLFLRILTGAIYSGFLFAGLSLAIVALEKLFDLDIDERIFGHLFFTISGIFNTLFFLAGVPKLNTEKPETNYPQGLKAFTQFVLIPLVSIYLVILIAYESKIVITMSLPYGWVSILILVYAVFGILSFLLIFPVSHLADNLWMKTFNKWFYYFLVPLLCLLYWAIIYRLSKYGFTPERYYVLVLALWLTFVVGYFLLKKTQNIKLIPMSLCITGLLTIVGPQSAQHVSKVSQLNRFVNYIQQNETQKLSKNDQRELSSVVDYLMDYHGSELLIEAADHKLDTVSKMGIGLYNRKIMTALGLEYYSRYSSGPDSKEYFNVSTSSSQIFNVTEFDFMVAFDSYGTIHCDSCLHLNGKNYSVDVSKNGGQLTVTINGDELHVDVANFVNNLKPISGVDYTQAELTQIVETDTYKLTLLYANLSGNIQQQKYKIEGYSGTIGIHVKQ